MSEYTLTPEERIGYVARAAATYAVPRPEDVTTVRDGVGGIWLACWLVLIAALAPTIRAVPVASLTGLGIGVVMTGCIALFVYFATR